jgi:hypothetical protein
MLIFLSALAALVVALPVVWLLGIIDSRPIPPNAVLRTHLQLTLPATIAVAISAWCHTRDDKFVERQSFGLSMGIAWWSFPAFAAIFALFYCLETMISADQVAGLFAELAAVPAMAFFLILLSSLVLFIPRLIVECLVVRLVRSRWMRAALSGVDP